MSKKLVYILFATIVIPASIFQIAGITSVLSNSDNTSQAIETVQQEQVGQEANSSSENDSNIHTPWIPTHIAIPSASIDLAIVSQPQTPDSGEIKDGAANYAEGTGKAGENGGNIGLFAHDRANGFHQIKQLKTGDQILLSDSNNTAIYQVESRRVVEPQAIEVFNQRNIDEATLITCDGIFSNQRYVVKAKLVEEIYQ